MLLCSFIRSKPQQGGGRGLLWDDKISIKKVRIIYYWSLVRVDEAQNRIEIDCTAWAERNQESRCSDPFYTTKSINIKIYAGWKCGKLRWNPPRTSWCDTASLSQDCDTCTGHYNIQPGGFCVSSIINPEPESLSNIPLFSRSTTTPAICCYSDPEFYFFKKPCDCQLKHSRHSVIPVCSTTYNKLWEYQDIWPGSENIKSDQL